MFLAAVGSFVTIVLHFELSNLCSCLLTSTLILPFVLKFSFLFFSNNSAANQIWARADLLPLQVVSIIASLVLICSPVRMKRSHSG